MIVSDHIDLVTGKCRHCDRSVFTQADSHVARFTAATVHASEHATW